MIADARAQMMMRGHERLKITVGPATEEDIIKCAGGINSGFLYPATLKREAERELLGMLFEVRSDMEGFVIQPISD